MASSSKKKTTFAKMNRETAVRERRLRKQAKKEARKLAAATELDAQVGTTVDAEATLDGEQAQPAEALSDTSASAAEAEARA